MNNSFSAFKLFFDEFVYKKSSYVSYAKVEENLLRIGLLLNEVRHFSKLDVKAYMKKLNKATKDIKFELEEILKNNKPLMEYYRLIYNSIIDYSNDSLKDFPLIISNAFYNDYRLDNKTSIELENSANTIPKYSSVEKKNIRLISKDKPCLVYFIDLLKKSENKKKYDFFLDKMDVVLKLYPLYSENHFKYIERVTKSISGYEKIYKKLEEKIKLTDDYEDVYLRMKIAYRKKMNDWVVAISEMVNDYFDYLFNEKQMNVDAMKHLNVVNRVSYASYLEIIKEMKEQKKAFDRSFNEGVFRGIHLSEDNYLLRFKSLLINSYYDNRFIINIKPGNINDYVSCAINLYSLAVDLENNVLDYYLFLASHSKRLMRNNDVDNAIIKNLYQLYSPIECLDRFEASRKIFVELLDKESNEFKKQYNTELLSKRVEYDFKGMIPNVSAIKTKLNERCKDFIVENCLENVKNYDETDLYDTRNYDLEVLCEKLSFDDIVSLYDRLKSVFNNIEGYGSAPQEFICNVIYNRIGEKMEGSREDIMREICHTYLKEDPLFF